LVFCLRFRIENTRLFSPLPDELFPLILALVTCWPKMFDMVNSRNSCRCHKEGFFNPRIHLNSPRIYLHSPWIHLKLYIHLGFTYIHHSQIFFTQLAAACSDSDEGCFVFTTFFFVLSSQLATFFLLLFLTPC